MIDTRAVIRQCPIFAGFPDAAIDEAASHARIRHFDPDEVIYDKGTLQSSICVIAEGTVRISSVNAEGREAVLIIFDHGTWFGDTVFSPRTPRVYGARAHEAATIVDLPGEYFRTLMQRYPESYPVVLDLVSQRLWAAMSMIEDDALRGTQTRVGRRLLFLAQMHSGGHIRSESVTFRLTREHIANMMGMTRQGVHKVLKNFEAEGHIAFSYGRVTVNDPVALEQYLLTLD
ncbi:Crp/Fnr family transcriptional regulator [Marinobacter nanhaiticus D15-8W]|uniref:Crp/Fnr family transcriptional regulator n=1 Tax=Marinobacter nanhaiticus D15-8W TaxID=626887 RepID=N6WYS5_9GAMM|nr:Crp/Fnr family transcriptional regulator [Marinobacter nanhaiticus]ENO16247.1 Crp/Fnr family transcriptional regulator [Marinobacter nanhaiticus D15-8W]BES72896.1 Crp/Fnr family transcriptional regulator [Marinobacter nanhaiticus D15-8W]